MGPCVSEILPFEPNLDTTTLTPTYGLLQGCRPANKITHQLKIFFPEGSVGPSFIERFFEFLEIATKHLRNELSAKIAIIAAFDDGVVRHDQMV